MSNKASQVEFLLSGNDSWVGGKAEFFAAGTNTRRTIWLDPNKTTPAANPFQLDVYGTAQLYADGRYKIVIKNAAGVVTYTRDNLAYALQDGPWTDAAEYVSLTAAVAAIGSTVTSLLIDGTVTLTANTTIPSNITIVDTAKTRITLNGYALLGLRGARPEWFSDTGGVKEAVDACGNHGIVRLRKDRKYIEPGNIVITSRNVVIEGEDGERQTGNLGGSSIEFTGTGALFQLGAETHAGDWCGNYYDGPQGLNIRNVHLVTTATGRVALSNGLSTYLPGSYAVRDWYGGDVTLENVNIEGWEYGFWGVQSDIDRFENLTVNANKVGLWFGPRCDQAYIGRSYLLQNDTAVVIEGATGVTFEKPVFVLNGSATTPPFKINIAIYNSVKRGPWDTTIIDPWIEWMGAAQNISAFFSIGVGDSGASGLSAVTGVSILRPIIWVTDSTRYKYLAEIGEANFISIDTPSYRYSTNLTDIINYVGTGVINPSIYIRNHNGLSNLFANNGTGTPSFQSFSATSGAHRFGFGNVARDVSLVAFGDRQIGLSFTDSGTDNNYIFQSRKRFLVGFLPRSTTPSSGTWDAGDIYTYNNPVSTDYLGQVCTVGGTVGTYTEGRTATTDGTTTVTLSSASSVLKVGMYLTINGTTAVVVSISGTTMVMGSAITAGSGLAIAYRNPTFNGFGLIG